MKERPRFVVFDRDTPLPPRSDAFRFRKRWTQRSRERIGRMLPNIITMTALCTGLTAIHFGMSARWELAVASILIAGLLDGIDGRVARMLGVSTGFGAELDNLADFVNFGVAPALLTYFYALKSWRNIGWGFCLFFSACGALRLARFLSQDASPFPPMFSVGVPITIGALLALLPLVWTFVFPDLLPPPAVFALFMFLTSLLMISRIPTFVLKSVHVSPRNMLPVLVGVAGVVTSLLVAPWEGILVIGCGYVLSVPMSLLFWRRRYGKYAKKSEKKQDESV